MKQMRQRIAREVQDNWHYWRPIVYGVVKITLEEYDASSPLFVWKLNAAMDYRSELEKREFERAKAESK